MASKYSTALTKREKDVAELSYKGLGYNEIAQALFIARSTVNVHFMNIYSKLGINNRAQLLALKIKELREAINELSQHN